MGMGRETVLNRSFNYFLNLKFIIPFKLLEFQFIRSQEKVI